MSSKLDQFPAQAKKSRRVLDKMPHPIWCSARCCSQTAPINIWLTVESMLVACFGLTLGGACSVRYASHTHTLVVCADLVQWSSA
jgi:hypothetical protein